MTPSIFALAVLLPALFASGTRMVVVVMVSCVFGATAALELTFLGGAPVTLQIFSIPFLTWWALRAGGFGSIAAEIRNDAPARWLVCLVLYGVFTAIALPRYFFGETYVYNSSRAGTSLGVALAPLQPSTTNVTQSCYLIGGLATYLAMSVLLRRDAELRRFRDAVIFAAAVNLLAASAGLTEALFGISLGMSELRNAGYAVYDGMGEVGGLVRIQGAFPEASSFASFTAPVFAFLASLWRSNQCRHVTGPLALASLVFLCLSTSSTAYGTLAVYGFAIVLTTTIRSLLSAKPIYLTRIWLLIWFALVAICILSLVKVELFIRAGEFFELTVFRKLESSSGVERASWNNQAWNAFFETFGIGTGLGASRASNFFLVVLSNIGIIGALIFSAFLWSLFTLAFSKVQDKPVARASGHAVLIALIAGSFSSTVFDLGVAFYSFAAAAAAGNAASNKTKGLPISRHGFASRARTQFSRPPA